MNAMPSMVVATIFGSQGGSLRSLYLELETMGLLGSEISALAALTQLESLEVSLRFVQNDGTLALLLHIYFGEPADSSKLHVLERAASGRSHH